MGARRKLTLVVAGLAVCAGCGFTDPEIASFPFAIPEKEFSVDSADWELTQDPAFPTIDCGGMPGICAGAIASACGNEALCFGSCDGSNCRATALISQSQSMALGEEAPEFDIAGGEPLVSVTVETIEYDVTENTLNIDTPALTILVAPDAVTSPGDPQAVAIGTIPVVPAGATFADMQMDISVQGQEALRDRMLDYHTPFNLIAGAEVTLSAGDPVPVGRLTAKVRGTARARVETGCSASRDASAPWLFLLLLALLARAVPRRHGASRTGV